MTIVALDTFPINPGDIQWDAVTGLGSCMLFDRTAPEEVPERAADADIILTNKVPLTGQMMTRLPRLKYIGVMATGYNIVDVAAARERGIVVTNVPSYSTASVAQLASAFGMNVLVATRTPFTSSQTISCVDVDTVFRSSDVLSLHCPLTPETTALVNGRRLSTMKPNAFIINTGRGPLVDEQALDDALNAGRIAGAGIDVLSTEPPDAGNPLLSAKNCIITPHVGWSTFAARERLIGVIADNITAYMKGPPQNVVS